MHAALTSVGCGIAFNALCAIAGVTLGFSVALGFRAGQAVVEATDAGIEAVATRVRAWTASETEP